MRETPPWCLIEAWPNGGLDLPLNAKAWVPLAALAALLAVTEAAAKKAGACSPAPFGKETVYLRGTMNAWATLDSFAFRYRCDAYYLTVDLVGRQSFKIADQGWSDGRSFGGAPGTATALAVGATGLVPASAPGGAGDLSFAFEDPATLRLEVRAGSAMLAIGPVRFDDPAVPAVTDRIALSVQHDSRRVADKSPFGAVPAGTEVRFALSALPGIERATLVVEEQSIAGNQDRIEYRTLARLPLARDPGPGRDRWEGRHAFFTPGIYGYYFEIEAAGRKFVYQNNRDMVFWTREQGSNGQGTIEPHSAGSVIRRFRHTVHARDFQVPSWAQDAIYYYIFPDRFRNGDPSNDPRPFQSSAQWEAVEFHDNWLDHPWRPGSGDGSDGFGTNDFFGGDIAGIIEKLDYIAGLGANALYITPLFLAASNHKYDTADYRRIDPAFGSNSDFERLTAEAAKRGLRILVDASLNHSGRDSLYFDRFGRFPGIGAFEGGRIRPDSPYADWYRFNPGEADPDRRYTGWAGARDLPELNKHSRAFRQFAFGSPDSIMKLWLDKGASGWRMDVAPWVPDDFWAEWRAAIKAHRPDALLVAETWFDASKYFRGDSFDSTMNYIFRDTALNYAAGIKAARLVHNVELIRELYPRQSLNASMNLLSGHDTARSLHLLGYEGPHSGPEAEALAKRRLALAFFFQMTFPGAPAIFYGDEVGATGGDDPYNRVGYPWADRGGRPDLDLLGQVKALTRLRNSHPVLRRGTLGAPLHVDDHVLVLLRRDGPDWAVVGMNNALDARTVTVTLPDDLDPSRLVDALGGTVARADGRSLTIEVPALYGRVLIARTD